MKIEKLLHNSYNGEVATVSKNIVKTSEKHDFSADDFLSNTLQKINVEEEKLSFAIKQDKALSELGVKDDVRDNCLRALFNLVKGYQYHPDHSISAAAIVVSVIFNKYGLSNITHDNHAQESAMIESLLKDLETREAIAAIALLPGVTEAITAVRMAQDDFTISFVKLSESKAKNSSKDTATKIKAELLMVINSELVTYLRGMALAKPDIYNEFAATTAQIIADNNDKVRKRNNKKDLPEG